MKLPTAYLQGPDGQEFPVQVTEPDPADGTLCLQLDVLSHPKLHVVSWEEWWIRIVHEPADVSTRHSSVKELGDLIELVTKRDGTYASIPDKAAKIVSCLVALTDIEGDGHFEGFDPIDMIGARKLLGELYEYVKLTSEDDGKFNQYIGVVAQSLELARKYLQDKGYDESTAEFVHYEAAEDEEESPTWIFRTWNEVQSDFDDWEMLHDHFHLPHLPNMPYEQL